MTATVSRISGNILKTNCLVSAGNAASSTSDWLRPLAGNIACGVNTSRLKEQNPQLHQICS